MKGRISIHQLDQFDCIMPSYSISHSTRNRLKASIIQEEHRVSNIPWPGSDLIRTLGFLGAEAAQQDPIKAQFMQSARRIFRCGLCCRCWSGRWRFPEIGVSHSISKSSIFDGIFHYKWNPPPIYSELLKGVPCQASGERSHWLQSALAWHSAEGEPGFPLAQKQNGALAPLGVTRYSQTCGWIWRLPFYSTQFILGSSGSRVGG